MTRGVEIWRRPLRLPGERGEAPAWIRVETFSDRETALDFLRTPSDPGRYLARLVDPEGGCPAVTWIGGEVREVRTRLWWGAGSAPLNATTRNEVERWERVEGVKLLLRRLTTKPYARLLFRAGLTILAEFEADFSDPFRAMFERADRWDRTGKGSIATVYRTVTGGRWLTEFFQDSRNLPITNRRLSCLGFFFRDLIEATDADPHPLNLRAIPKCYSVLDFLYRENKTPVPEKEICEKIRRALGDEFYEIASRS